MIVTDILGDGIAIPQDYEKARCASGPTLVKMLLD